MCYFKESSRHARAGASAVWESAGKQQQKQKHIYSQPSVHSCNFLPFMAHRLTVTTVATRYVCSSRVRVHIFTRWSSLQDSNANTLLPFAVAGSSSVCVWHSQAPALVLMPAGGDLVDSPKRQLSNWPPPFCPLYDQTIVMLHPLAPGGFLPADCPKLHRSFTSGLMECSSKKDVAPMWRKQSSFLSGFSQPHSLSLSLWHMFPPFPLLSAVWHAAHPSPPFPFSGWYVHRTKSTDGERNEERGAFSLLPSCSGRPFFPPSAQLRTGVLVLIISPQDDQV